MNNLFNGFLKKEMNINEDIDIKVKTEEVTNLDDSLLYHPFIDKLDNELNNEENTNLILYRINKHNDFNYIEYYLNKISCKS